jgi:hypothetical protein
MNDILVAIIAATAGLLGAAVGGFSTIGITYINRRFDDRRHLREIAISTAITHWEKERDWAVIIGERTNKPVTVAALDVYIVHMLQLAELVSNKTLTSDNIASELAKIRAFSAHADKAYN